MIVPDHSKCKSIILCRYPYIFLYYILKSLIYDFILMQLIDMPGVEVDACSQWQSYSTSMDDVRSNLLMIFLFSFSWFHVDVKIFMKYYNFSWNIVRSNCNLYSFMKYYNFSCCCILLGFQINLHKLKNYFCFSLWDIVF